jgi:hypothetical protein
MSGKECLSLTGLRGRRCLPNTSDSGNHLYAVDLGSDLILLLLQSPTVRYSLTITQAIQFLTQIGTRQME